MGPVNATNPELSAASVARWLAADWGLADVALTRLSGGMNSEAWLVNAAARTLVAKIVPTTEARRIAGGMMVASVVQAAGIPAGAPLPALDGATVTSRGERSLALLTFVDGTGLIGESDADQRLIGDTLARAHLAVRGHEVPSAERFHWLDPAADRLSLRAWIRPAVAGALASWDALPPESLTWGLLHSDPAPEAFLLDPAGVCGLIDWDRALLGPLMYDVASAVMYVGGPRYAAVLLDAYIAAGALARDEVERSLLPMLRLRWAVQADYFAMRVATNDLTGIADASENEEGLEDARRAFADFGRGHLGSRAAGAGSPLR